MKKTTYIFNHILLFALTLGFVLTVSCGDSGDQESDAGLSQLQKVMSSHASQSKIPARLMLAVGYLESRLSPTPSRALYLNQSTSSEDGTRGLPIAETAFGVSKAELGIVANPKQNDLVEQAKFYSRWLRKRIDAEGIKLPAGMGTMEDKIRWIWEVAQQHRIGTRVRNDVRSIFAREIVNVLNEGFYWQNNETGESIVVSPESPRIRNEDLPLAYQSLLELATSSRTDIPNVEFLPLATLIGEEGNRPSQVEVIHCPLSLSGCLELQSQLTDGDIKMEAHYIIPPDKSVVDGPVQIARHTRAVKLTDHQGNHRVVNNAIVVMLVGNSGRFDDGYRVDANPNWLTKDQIVDLTTVVGSVCELLGREGVTTLETCLSIPVDRPRLERELNFQLPTGATYRWGDLPDFDARIFASYIANPGTKLAGAVNFSEDIYRSKAGKAISLPLGFTDRVRLVVIERLVKCPDKSLKWAKVHEQQLRDTTKTVFTTRIWDSGANGNGTHFFRAKAYSKDQLIGWDVSEVYLSHFEKENLISMVPEVCRS